MGTVCHGILASRALSCESCPLARISLVESTIDRDADSTCWLCADTERGTKVSSLRQCDRYPFLAVGRDSLPGACGSRGSSSFYSQSNKYIFTTDLIERFIRHDDIASNSPHSGSGLRCRAGGKHQIQWRYSRSIRKTATTNSIPVIG